MSTAIHRRRLLPRAQAPNPLVLPNKIGPYQGVGGLHPSSPGLDQRSKTPKKRQALASLNQSWATKRTKKFPSFPLAEQEILVKAKLIITLVETCIFSLPFLATKRREGVQFDEEKPRSLDEVKAKLANWEYVTTNEIFEDMEEVFEGRRENRDVEEISFTLDNHQRMVRSHAEERDALGEEMKLKLIQWTEKTFLDETMEERPVAGKIFTALQKRFPHVDEEELKVQACEVAHSKEDIWKRIVRELNQKNENRKPDAIYQKFRFASPRHLELDGEHAVHKYIAGYQFYKMMMKWAEPEASIPIPLRKVENANDAIASIDYIKNPRIEKEYEAEKIRFQMEGKQVTETLLFHGTAVASVDSILKSNFSLDHSPIQQQESSRDKRRMFGEGIYFSEMPAVSLMYGNGLVLCKVLLGNCESFTPRPGVPQPDIPESFDSREVKSRDSGVIHVVRRPAQILPYCVIQLKNEALSSEYRKPTVSPVPAPSQGQQQDSGRVKVIAAAGNPPQRGIIPFPPLTLNTVMADVRDASSKEDLVQTTLTTFTTSMAPSARPSPSLLNKSLASVADFHLCSVCLEALVDDVVSLPCNHQLHLKCAQSIVEKGQGGPTCIQCPQCQTIHGTRTGTQPRDGDMTWSKLDSSLPGHPDCGTIVIRYRFQAGVQGAEHPNPGKAFQAPGFPRVAYLPDSIEGQKVLQGLCEAFRRRLLFTVGKSLTFGQDDCVTWAGVHHKTMVEGTAHGYPDPGYVQRVLQELNERGVTEQDMANGGRANGSDSSPSHVV